MGCKNIQRYARLSLIDQASGSGIRCTQMPFHIIVKLIRVDKENSFYFFQQLFHLNLEGYWKISTTAADD